MLIYLASPFTHPDKKKMKTRFVNVCKLAALLTRQNRHVLCPIASSYPIEKYGKLIDTTWEYWKNLDTDYLNRCDILYISLLDDEWMNSVGMQEEYKIAKSLKLPVFFIDKKGKVLDETTMKNKQKEQLDKFLKIIGM